MIWEEETDHEMGIGFVLNPKNKKYRWWVDGHKVDNHRKKKTWVSDPMEAINIIKTTIESVRKEYEENLQKQIVVLNKQLSEHNSGAEKILGAL